MEYQIEFDDGVVYTSPDIRSNDPGWATEHNEKLTGIRQISIKLPFDKILILSGFEAYNFFVEASKGFGAKSAQIESFFFLGHYQKHVVIWEINYRKKQVTKRLTPYGKEYYGTATRGWRAGLYNRKAESGITVIH